MRSPFVYLLLALGGPLLVACSQADSPTSPPAAPAKTPTPATPAAAQRADSLNGIPGHHFGEPVSAFPGLKRVPSNPGGYQVYSYDADGGQDKSWFGRHPESAHGLVYLFVEGQFAGLRTAEAYPGRALLEQAQYLLGPGSGEGEQRDWQGERVVATWRPTDFGTGSSYQQLQILSKPLQARMQQLGQQQLRNNQ